MKITVKQLEALTPADNGRTFREEGGVVAKVRAGARGLTVQFTYQFKHGGVKRDCRLGTWPKQSLGDLRLAREKIRSHLVQGVDPILARTAEKLNAQTVAAATVAEAARQAAENLTVANLFEAWMRDGVARSDGNAELRRSFGKDVLPLIGALPLRRLSDQDLLAVLRALKARGISRHIVIRCRDMGQMLRWGEKRKPWRPLLIDGNPADLINPRNLLEADYQEERDRVLNQAEIRELHDVFIGLEARYAALPAGAKYTGIRPVNRRVQLACWICLSTLCRIGELLKAQWQHVDLQQGTWRIPAEASKGHRGKRQEHHVFLSGFALEQFRQLHALTRHTPFCFPNKDATNHVDTKTVTKLIGDRQCRFKQRSKRPEGRHHDDSLVLSHGTRGEWTPHDLRRTGATTMQALGVALNIIDRCQNHLLGGSRIRRHYLHHNYAEEKTAAWQLLGDFLSQTLRLETFNIIEIERRT